jgi:hypothetical protein
MKKIYLGIGVTLVAISFSALGQTNSSQEMKTFSPYTPEQLKSFNNQKISPAEGPFGPVNLTQQQLNLQQKPNLDSKFFNVPDGEQEAEALETESADPYQPMTPAISF